MLSNKYVQKLSLKKEVSFWLTICLSNKYVQKLSLKKRSFFWTQYCLDQGCNVIKRQNRATFAIFVNLGLNRSFIVGNLKREENLWGNLHQRKSLLRIQIKILNDKTQTTSDQSKRRSKTWIKNANGIKTSCANKILNENFGSQKSSFVSFHS